MGFSEFLKIMLKALTAILISTYISLDFFITLIVCIRYFRKVSIYSRIVFDCTLKASKIYLSCITKIVCFIIIVIISGWPLQCL